MHTSRHKSRARAAAVKELRQCLLMSRTHEGKVESLPPSRTFPNTFRSAAVKATSKYAGLSHTQDQFKVRRAEMHVKSIQSVLQSVSATVQNTWKARGPSCSTAASWKYDRSCSGWSLLKLNSGSQRHSLQGRGKLRSLPNSCETTKEKKKKKRKREKEGFWGPLSLCICPFLFNFRRMLFSFNMGVIFFSLLSLKSWTVMREKYKERERNRKISI